jgi:alpha-L-fucosidase
MGFQPARRGAPRHLLLRENVLARLLIMILCVATACAGAVRLIAADAPAAERDQAAADGKWTRDKTHLYLNLTKWPPGGEVVAPMKGWARRAYMMGDKNKMLLMQATPQGLRITLPEKPSNPPVVVVTLEADTELLAKVGEKSAGIPAGVDGVVKLMAVDATLVGKDLHLERKGDGDENIGFWSDVKSYPEWTAIVQKTGEYEVLVDYACDNGTSGSQVEVVSGESRTGFKINGTGSWETFKNVSVGTIRIEKAGAVKIRVTVKAKPGGAVMNLRSVELRPMAKP